MKINLKKANQLTSLIVERLNPMLYVHTTVSVDEFDIPEEKINRNQEAVRNHIERALDLNNALFTIRRLIGSANEKSGINFKLASLAQVEKEIQLYESLVEGATYLEDDYVERVLKPKLQRIRDRNNDGSTTFAQTNYVTTEIFDKEEFEAMETYLINLKKNKVKLKDELLETNIKTKISLEENVVKILEKHNII
jgi:uncharacterized protein YdcH (DUF465 family)